MSALKTVHLNAQELCILRMVVAEEIDMEPLYEAVDAPDTDRLLALKSVLDKLGVKD